MTNHTHLLALAEHFDMPLAADDTNLILLRGDGRNEEANETLTISIESNGDDELWTLKHSHVGGHTTTWCYSLTSVIKFVEKWLPRARNIDEEQPKPARPTIQRI